MKSDKELDEIAERIYWALEHGGMGDSRRLLKALVAEGIAEDREMCSQVKADET